MPRCATLYIIQIILTDDPTLALVPMATCVRDHTCIWGRSLSRGRIDICARIRAGPAADIHVHVITVTHAVGRALTHTGTLEGQTRSGSAHRPVN